MTASRAIALPFWAALALVIGGCSYERHPEIPSDAMMTTEGDKVLSQRFTEPGMVYVFDRNDNKMVYSGRVKAGETITVEPDKDRISISGHTVYDKDINDFDTRRIFFEPDSRSPNTMTEHPREGT